MTTIIADELIEEHEPQNIVDGLLFNLMAELYEFRIDTLRDYHAILSLIDYPVVIDNINFEITLGPARADDKYHYRVKIGYDMPSIYQRRR